MKVLLASAALLLAVALPAAAQHGNVPLSGNSFPITMESLFLTGQTATVAGTSGVLTLANSPGPAGSVNYLLPGVNVLGLVVEQASYAWYGTTPFDKDTEITGDAVFNAYFTVNAQATTVFTATVQDVEPSGAYHAIASDQQQFITVGNAGGQAATLVPFYLHLTGDVVHGGHFLRLELKADTLNALVVLNYGAGSPSGITGFQHRWLDSDGDGVADSDETKAGTNPLAADQRADLALDTDADGIPDAVEKTLGTDPHKVDTDGDGFGDGVEWHAGTDPLDPNSKPTDANGNGLPDSFESKYFDNRVYNGTTYNLGGAGTGPTDDPDHDGCNNLCEAMHGTDPLNPDTDGDGIPDGAEVNAGTDPAVASFKSEPAIPEPVTGVGIFAVASTLSLVALFRRP